MFESYVQQDENVMRVEVARPNKELNLFRNYKGHEREFNIGNLCKSDIKNLKYEQRQIILYKVYWNTKNKHRNTYGSDNKKMGEEIDNIVRDSVLKRTSIRSTQDNIQSDLTNEGKDDERYEESGTPRSSNFSFSVFELALS